MPKELARVIARYNELEKKVPPLLKELHDYERDYVLMSSNLWAALDHLAEVLKYLGVRNAADPRAAKDPEVMDTLESCEKYKTLMADRHGQFSTTAKKVDAIRVEAAKLEKDVNAVIKAKSGFFSTSKSLPQLKELSTKLVKFGDELETATAAL